jgi:hypothetical protein
MRVSNDFPHGLPVIETVMERGARTHQGQDWRALPVGFHLCQRRLKTDPLLLGVTEVKLTHPAQS